MDSLEGWAVLLHIGIFVLVAPMIAIENSTTSNRTSSWKRFEQGKPKWVVLSIKLLGLFFAVHFVLFLVQSHGATPEIKNGIYVLDNHGKLVKTLTLSEYRKLKVGELRLFATGWLFFYAMLTAYGWFPVNG